ncbi:hypothetical protein GW17_00015337 [Ensete ventricosum]|nr:hypothetical protein GW17_00015337 [Ensete ventricosum]
MQRYSRPRDYMGSQVEINAKMRSILADWLTEVHHKFELMPETLYLTFYLIDAYLSVETVPRRELQLVGVSSMLVACKYEEIWAPQNADDEHGVFWNNRDCAQHLLSFHASAADSKLRAVYNKYSSSRRGAVALRSPATKLL